MADGFRPGEHPLPARIPIATAVPRRRARRWVPLSIAAAVVLAAGATQLGADLAYDDAHTGFEDSAVALRTGQDDLDAAVADLRAAADAASGIAAVDSGRLVPDEDRSALDDAISAAGPVADQADAEAGTAVPGAAEKPLWPWQLFAQASELRAGAGALDERSESTRAVLSEVTATGSALSDAAVAAVRAAADAATGFEADHVNARNPEIVELRTAAASIRSSVRALGPTTADRLGALEDAAAAVLRTERAELAEKAGRLHDERVRIEAFARGLAPGVLLDFDWSSTVPGYEGRSYGGWTTWWYADPGYATIALSDNVAEQWPATWAKALVAHEVGHAISVKCADLYDADTPEIIEEWATAWAISQGFTDPSNGVDEYGRPSQKMLDAATRCR